MTCCCDILTKNYELEESRKLFYSLKTSEQQFCDCFLDLFDIDYGIVFGKQPKEVFLFEILKKFYHNDYFIRYSFIKKALMKSSAISFEELPVCDSRVDLISINGKSVAYEIKTEFDNYTKLKKQLNDYSKCFEYLYVICPTQCVDKIKAFLPHYCGIYSYEGKNMVRFKMMKESSLSPNLNGYEMLKLFQRKELFDVFHSFDLLDISKNESLNTINDALKLVLKKRYKKKWNDLMAKVKGL